jgi:hypothetical protein
MRATTSARGIWWGRLDWLIFVPLLALLASFWVYLAGPSPGWVSESLRQFYGMRHTAEIHSPLVIAGSITILLYSFTLFLPRRLLSDELQDHGRLPAPCCSFCSQQPQAWLPLLTMPLRFCKEALRLSAESAGGWPRFRAVRFREGAGQRGACQPIMCLTERPTRI